MAVDAKPARAKVKLPLKCSSWPMFIWNVKHAMANALKKRFLKLTFHDKNIDDILNMTIDDATEFFEDHDQDKIVKKLKPLKDVGLGYVN